LVAHPAAGSHGRGQRRHGALSRWLVGVQVAVQVAGLAGGEEHNDVGKPGGVLHVAGQDRRVERLQRLRVGFRCRRFNGGLTAPGATLSTGCARRIVELDEVCAHANSRFTTSLAKVPNIAADYDDPKGVPVDAIIFGGRTRDREALIRANHTDTAEGIYDGLTPRRRGDGRGRGCQGPTALRPHSMRPFMFYREGAYAAPPSG
jgi:hypothetical protein